MKRKVVLGLLDSNQDVSRKQDRWGVWRPAISVSQHHDFSIHRYELIHEQRDSGVVGDIVEDLLTASPETEVRTWELSNGALGDFSSSLKTLGDFVTSYRFIVEAEDYFLHVSNLAIPAQLSLIFLASHGVAPARLIQSRMPSTPDDILGSYEIIDVRPGAAVDRVVGDSTLNASVERSLRGGIECRNPQFNGIIRRLASILGRKNLALLFTGKRGAGKSTLARRFYHAKRERSLLDGPLVEADCAQLPLHGITALLRQFT
ncbi:MAG: RNA repair transcriptional activator RtcR family protein, partial [Bryobacterales bacterium]|nr:RNA repair transcriptional activator RtcR family protein [Bryobacterales bacterium]